MSGTGGKKNYDFQPISRCISITVRERARLVLITNRKSYIGFRWLPDSMTLDDLERQNKGFFMDFWQFRAARHNSKANCAENN